jgi:hypothetical protein
MQIVSGKGSMSSLIIGSTDRTPEIEFTFGKLHIWGTYAPDEPYEFYKVLYDWIKIYSKSPAPLTFIEIGITHTRGFFMEYIESILQDLIYLNDDQHKVQINWYYSQNSISVKAGEHLSRVLEYPFNFVEVEELP